MVPPDRMHPVLSVLTSKKPGAKYYSQPMPFTVDGEQSGMTRRSRTAQQLRELAL